MKNQKQTLIILGIIFVAILILPKLGTFSTYNLVSTSYRSSPSSIPGLFAVSTCPVQQGYDYCDFNEYKFGVATARAELLTSDPKDINGNTFEYMIKKATINYLCNGDKAYVYKNIEDWNLIKCDSLGCYGGEPIPLKGEYDVTSTDANLLKFVCWDRKNEGSDTAWTWVGRGWPSNFKIVNCYKDSDCGIGTCDKSLSDYRLWKCTNEPARVGNVKIPAWIIGILLIGGILFLIIWKRKK